MKIHKLWIILIVLTALALALSACDGVSIEDLEALRASARDAGGEDMMVGSGTGGGYETGAKSVMHDEILSTFHTTKDECQATFDAALAAFHQAKDEVPEGPDREAQIAALEAEKDAAEAEKDACIAAAEAEKDAALTGLDVEDPEDSEDIEDGEDSEDGTDEENGEEMSPEDKGALHDEILNTFFTAKQECVTAFEDAKAAFHQAKDDVPKGPDREAQIAALEAEKDAAEAEKDACIAAAEAEKDAALAALDGGDEVDLEDDIEDESEDEGEEVVEVEDVEFEVKGEVTAVSANSITINGETYLIDTSENLAALFSVGDEIEIEFILHGDDSITIKKFKIEHDD